MANNKSIQFLRGTSTQKKRSSEILLPGQPFYEIDTNSLYIGDGTSLNSKDPVNLNYLEMTRGLLWYQYKVLEEFGKLSEEVEKPVYYTFWLVVDVYGKSYNCNSYEDTYKFLHDIAPSVSNSDIGSVAMAHNILTTPNIHVMGYLIARVKDEDQPNPVFPSYKILRLGIYSDLIKVTGTDELIALGPRLVNSFIGELYSIASSPDSNSNWQDVSYGGSVQSLKIKLSTP